MQNAHQPMVHSRTGRKLRGPFQRPHAGGLHQVFRDMPLPGQQQAVAPQTRQVLAQFCSYCLIAGDNDLRLFAVSGFR
jgi:hypothetical protein